MKKEHLWHTGNQIMSMYIMYTYNKCKSIYIDFITLEIILCVQSVKHSDNHSMWYYWRLIDVQGLRD